MPGWSLPSDQEIRSNGGFSNPEGKWISAEMHFGEVPPPAPEVPPSLTNNPEPAPIDDNSWRPPSDAEIKANGGFSDPEGRWISAALHFGEQEPEQAIPPAGDSGWRPPSDEVIRRDGGFTDPRGVWISAAIHFGEIQPDPNWRMPSDEEIRANAGFHDANGTWISSSIHFSSIQPLNPSIGETPQTKASEGQIEE